MFRLTVPRRADDMRGMCVCFCLNCFSLNQLQSLHLFDQLLAHLGRASRDDHTGLLERVDLILSTALSAGNDGTSMTHTAAGRGRKASNERHHWFRFDALKKPNES